MPQQGCLQQQGLFRFCPLPKCPEEKPPLCLLDSAARGKQASALPLRVRWQEIMLHLAVFCISITIIMGSEDTGSGWPFSSNCHARTPLPVLRSIKSTLFRGSSSLPLPPTTSPGKLLCFLLSFTLTFRTHGLSRLQKD